MDTSFEYRSYLISHENGAFIAKPRDREPFQIRSISMLRVTRAIDALWNALEDKVMAPAWLYDDQDIVDLDTAKDAMLVVDHSAFPSFPLGPVVGEPAQAAA
jgi:hypothetical protein